MHTYDLNVILDPNLSESQAKTEKDAIAAQIARNDGEVIGEDDWGKKRLAYEIRKLREGHYIIYTLKLPPEAPKVIETALRQRDNVMRVLSVRHRPEWHTRKVKEPKPQASRPAPAAKPADAPTPTPAAPAASEAPTEPASDPATSESAAT